MREDTSRSGISTREYPSLNVLSLHVSEDAQYEFRQRTVDLLVDDGLLANETCQRLAIIE